MRQTDGTNTLDFQYDAAGQMIGFIHNGTPYYYLRNILNDVSEIVDENGDIVAKYRYDAYGNTIIKTGTVADINPIRYRGYYFDAETNWYHTNQVKSHCPIFKQNSLLPQGFRELNRIFSERITTMIKFKTIIMCVAAVLMLSSCSVTQNGLSDPLSEPSGSVAENVSVTETYNELTADRSTVTIDGILYRNGFQGDLILRNPKYGTEPLLSDSTGQYYRLEETKYDLIYNASGENKGVSENIYCRADQWQELSEYYSTSTNFVYRCVVKSSGGTSETIDIDEMDIKKLNELVEFCESNAYRANAFADSDNIKSVPSANIGDKTYRFGMSSNDGLFSLNAREFCIVEGVLVYKHREVMSEGNTLIVDLPEELSDYFTTVINNLNSDE